MVSPKASSFISYHSFLILLNRRIMGPDMSNIVSLIGVYQNWSK